MPATRKPRTSAKGRQAGGYTVTITHPPKGGPVPEGSAR